MFDVLTLNKDNALKFFMQKLCSLYQEKTETKKIHAAEKSMENTISQAVKKAKKVIKSNIKRKDITITENAQNQLTVSIKGFSEQFFNCLSLFGIDMPEYVSQF